MNPKKTHSSPVSDENAKDSPSHCMNSNSNNNVIILDKNNHVIEMS